MHILTIIIIIVIVGVILWLINRYIPMDAVIKRLLNIVIVIFLIIWLLKVFGLFSYLSDARV